MREQVKVDLPRPRNGEMVTDSKFVDLKARLMGALSERGAGIAG